MQCQSLWLRWHLADAQLPLKWADVKLDAAGNEEKAAKNGIASRAVSQSDRDVIMAAAGRLQGATGARGAGLQQNKSCCLIIETRVKALGRQQSLKTVWDAL